MSVVYCFVCALFHSSHLAVQSNAVAQIKREVNTLETKTEQCVELLSVQKKKDKDKCQLI